MFWLVCTNINRYPFINEKKLPYTSHDHNNENLHPICFLSFTFRLPTLIKQFLRQLVDLPRLLFSLRCISQPITINYLSHGWHNYNKRTYSLFFLFFSVVWTMLCSCFLLLTRSDGVLAFSSACNDSHAWAHAKNNECMHACMHTTWFCRLFNSSIHNMLCLHAIMQLLLYTEMSLCSYLTAVKVKPFL